MNNGNAPRAALASALSAPPVPAGGEVLRCTHAGQRSRAARPGPDVGRDEPGGRDEARDPCAVPCTHRNLLIRVVPRDRAARSEEHTSELQSLMRISYAVFCLKKKNTIKV